MELEIILLCIFCLQVLASYRACSISRETMFTDAVHYRRYLPTIRSEEDCATDVALLGGFSTTGTAFAKQTGYVIPFN